MIFSISSSESGIVEAFPEKDFFSFPFVQSMYRGNSGAWLYGLQEGIKKIVIEEGVTQGCTLGSFLYSLATFPLVKAIQESLGGEGISKFVKFFVDDGSLCADFDFFFFF